MKCVICGSDLVYERVDDGIKRYRIDSKTKELVNISSNSNGSTRVYCSSDEGHDVDEILQEQVMDYVESN